MATSVYVPVRFPIVRLAPGPGYISRSFITMNLPDGITSANPSPLIVTLVLAVLYPSPRFNQLGCANTPSAVRVSTRTSPELLGSISVQVGPSV